jgi:hypothetical protein
MSESTLAAATEGSRPLSTPLRRLLQLFAGLAFVAGVLLFVLSEETNRFFSWNVEPPLAAAFLGASYWAAFLLILWSSRQTSWARARAAVPPVVSIAVLLLVATLIHLDRFDFDSLFGWFWLAAYVLAPPLTLTLVADQLRAPGGDGKRAAPLPRALRAALALQAAAMLGIGGALFVAPGTSDSLLPWEVSPLTGRVIGAFVLGFGIAALHAVLENDLSRFEGAALAYVGLGLLQLVAALRFQEDLEGAGAAESVYWAFLVTVVVVGVYGFVLARRASGSSTALRASSRS